MTPQSLLRTLTVFAAAALAMIVGALPAQAVPSFARQTGFPCEQCHTSFPELTAFGRHFKAEGYTMTTTSTVTAPGGELALNATPPLSYMLQVGYTRTSKAPPDAAVDPATGDPLYPDAKAQNGTILLPQELSLFYAGRISPKIGAFTQITYSVVDDHFSMDNTDIRAADSVTMGDNTLVYGLTINNNPTVQDLWNSTPAWGFPFAASDIAPGPSAAVLLDGGFAQQVAGLGGYLTYYGAGGMLYAEYTLYQSMQLGSPVPLDSQAGAPVIKGMAPYLRLAYEYDFGSSSWEVGLLNLTAKMTPAGSPLDSTPEDKIADTGVDTQLQLASGDDIYGVKALYIKEKQTWGQATLDAGAASNGTDNLTSTKVTATYTHRHAWGANLQLFSITGDEDAALYGGKPDSAGNIIEVNYTPWLNTRFSVQYTMFNKLDGTSDGASDANSLYLLAWFMF
jgi:hypothetical protein